MIVIRNLLKKYGNIMALNGLNVIFRDNEVTAVLGENGAGKTTLLKICAGVIPFDLGMVKIDGLDIRKESMEARKRTGYLPEMPYLYERLTGREFLSFISSIREIDNPERKIEMLSKKLGIYDFLDYELGTYSKGMKQKISIIAAIIHSPRNLLLDEPVYGLDPLTSRALQDFIKERSGTTVIATHSTELVEKIANRVHIMKRGRIVFTGAIEEIMEKHGSVRNAYFSAVK